MACRLVGAKPLYEPNVGILLIGTLGIKFRAISIEINIFSLKKLYLKMSSAKWWPFCPGGASDASLKNTCKHTTWIHYVLMTCLRVLIAWVSCIHFVCYGMNIDRNWHDDVIKWKHFPRYWLYVRGIHRSPVNSPHKGQWRGALTFSLISAWLNGWVNNRKAGALRSHRAHYDVIVMEKKFRGLIFMI